MRFRSHEIGDIRRGEMTLVHLPYERRPLRFKPGHFYALERVDDVRVELEDGTVGYQARCATLAGEFVQVQDVARRLVEAVTDADALLQGFESAEEWKDVFFCDHGEYSEVWRVEFAYSLDAPSFMAVQAGQDHPEQYVHSQVRAIDDAETVGEDYLQAFAIDADQWRERKRAQSQCDRRPLWQQVKDLEESGDTQLDSVRKRVEQVQRRQQRRAA